MDKDHKLPKNLNGSNWTQFGQEMRLESWSSAAGKVPASSTGSWRLYLLSNCCDIFSM